MADNYQYILREPLPLDDFDRFVFTPAKELLKSFGYREVERVLRTAFVRVQNRLSHNSATDAVQKLFERVIANAHDRSAIKGKATAGNHQCILREPLPLDDFDMFVSILVKELLKSFGYTEVERVLRPAFVWIRTWLSCDSTTDAAQELANQIIARGYDSVIRGR